MAKAKRDRRASIRNMPTDDALEALNRLEQMEREQQAAVRSTEEPADTDPHEVDER